MKVFLAFIKFCLPLLLLVLTAYLGYKQPLSFEKLSPFSLLPALSAIILTLLWREPLFSLILAAVCGSFLLGKYNFLQATLKPVMMSESAVTILLLYLVLLGALSGLWQRLGAAQAFANFMVHHFVRGPRSAKFTAWLMGMLFFQGGTISAALVGTVVKPVADRFQVSHEELSYIVDSTASPVAILLAFNAWPLYVQAFLYVPGVSFLATESDRLQFFFSALPLSFYALLAVLSTLLFSGDITFFVGKRMKKAILRARRGQGLDAAGALPLSLLVESPTTNGQPADLLISLALLVVLSVTSYWLYGRPDIILAFSVAISYSIVIALFRKYSLRFIIEAIVGGWRGAIYGAAVLISALTLGEVTQSLGAAQWLSSLVGDQIAPLWLPAVFFMVSALLAFSTGSSWGTFAVVFPLAMPLAWTISQQASVTDIRLYMMVCFAAVLNASVYADQCSPISDTTILSAMATGADLSDHVLTQLLPATIMASAALVGYTLIAWYCL